MQIDLIHQSYHECLDEFKVTNIKRKWDILFLVEAGEYSIHIKGERKPFVLTKNEIALIPAGIEFDREVKSAVTYYHISFYPQGDHPFYLSASAGKLKLPEGQVESVLKSIKRAYLLPDNGELITHMVERIFAENYLFGGTEKTKFKPFSEEIENTIRYMRKNLDKKIDTDELADRVFLSHVGLINKFKQELNTTPSNYLYLLRMRSAKRLLLNYSYSITEISEMCGYQNPYYFTNSFRRYTGMSPSAFRKYHLADKT